MIIFGFAIPGAALLKMMAVLTVAILPVRVMTNSGEKIEGTLEAFAEASLVVETDGGSVNVPYDQLVTLQSDAEERTGPTFRVTLLSGSKIFAQDLAMKDDSITIEPRRQLPLRVNIKEVKSIRFQGADARTDAQWLGLLEQEGRGDLLAIRREGDRLDPYRGVARAIGQGKVSFDLDENSVNAPIDKLEGVIFGGNRSVSENAAVRVTDIYGSSWSAQSITPGQANDGLTLKLNGTLEHTIPLNQVRLVRWSSGLQLLAEIAPADQSFESFFQSKVDPKLMEAWFGPGDIDESDLLMHGNSRIEYRVEPGFGTLAGSVQRSKAVQKAGKVIVSIAVDEKVRWKETLSDSSRLGFELPLQDARRIRIEVQCGDDGDLGDTVRFSRPRLVK